MSAVLSNLSEALAATVAAAESGVARVEARGRLAASGIVWSPDGIIIAANHAVEADDGISVGLASGQSAAATLVGRDPTTDLAVLRAQASGLATASWSDLSDLRVGHLVLALGRPGRSIAATLGIVSALGEAWRTPAGGRLDRYLQTDVVMYPGFSGGPLVEASGKALGLNTSALLRGVSVTVPGSTVRRVVESLLAHGKVRRGYLGVGAQPVRLPSGLAQQAGQETGLLVVSVEPGGPAERGGLFLGDVLIGLDGQPLRGLDDLLSALGGDRVGAQVRARILRGGQTKELALAVGERP